MGVTHDSVYTLAWVCEFSILSFIHFQITDKENLFNNWEHFNPRLSAFILLNILEENSAMIVFDEIRC